jgi:hypothetical protein
MHYLITQLGQISIDDEAFLSSRGKLFQSFAPL